MAESSENVFVAKPKAGGAVWSAPSGTELPKDASTALADSFKSLGFISSDGITNSVETSTEDIMAYGGQVVRVVQTSRKESYSFTPIETNQHVLGEVYCNENVTVGESGNITVLHNDKRHPARVYVIETLLDDNKVQRDVIPSGRVTEVGEKTYADGSAIASQITLTCEPDASGNTVYTYIAQTA